MKNAYSQDLLTDFLKSEEHKLQEESDMTNDSKGPSEWTIKKILGFSSSLSVQRSAMIGRIEQIQN